MFKTYIAFVFSIFALHNATQVLGQHCAPIVESYLQSVSLRHSEDGIALEIDYKKTGGQRKNGYQAYILAYSQSDAEKIAAMTPQEALETKRASVVHTQLAERQENGCYRIQCSLATPAFVAAMLKDSRLDRQQVNDFGGWKSFKEGIRFAVFIPFLEDEKYSVIKGLPTDKHECNYVGESALLFDTLSQTVSVHFGVVQAVQLPVDQYHVQINGHRPLAKVNVDAK